MSIELSIDGVLPSKRRSEVNIRIISLALHMVKSHRNPLYSYLKP
jgi:hypothetical protein